MSSEELVERSTIGKKQADFLPTFTGISILSENLETNMSPETYYSPVKMSSNLEPVTDEMVDNSLSNNLDNYAEIIEDAYPTLKNLLVRENDPRGFEEDPHNRRYLGEVLHR